MYGKNCQILVILKLSFASPLFGSALVWKQAGSLSTSFLCFWSLLHRIRLEERRRRRRTEQMMPRGQNGTRSTERHHDGHGPLREVCIFMCMRTTMQAQNNKQKWRKKLPHTCGMKKYFDVINSINLSQASPPSPKKSSKNDFETLCAFPKNHTPKQL